MIQFFITGVLLVLVIRDEHKRKQFLKQLVKDRVIGKADNTESFDVGKGVTVTVTRLKSANNQKKWQVEFAIKNGTTSLYVYDELTDTIKGD